MYPEFSEESRLISSGGKMCPRIAQASPVYPAFSEESRLISSGWKVWLKSSATNRLAVRKRRKGYIIAGQIVLEQAKLNQDRTDF